MSFEIVDPHHYSHFLSNFCLNWDLHDVVLVCNDGVKLPAHKVILFARMSFFASMFLRWKDSDIPEVTLPYSSECTKKLLGYIYSGKLDPSDCSYQVLCELMDASRMMGIFMSCVKGEEKCDLYDIIENFIIEKVLMIARDEDYIDDEDGNPDDENGTQVKPNDADESQLNICVGILNLSIEHHFPTLVNLSISYIKDRALLFLKSDALTSLSTPALHEVLHLDVLADSPEVGIFNAVVRWLNASQDNMEQKDYILPKIRLDQMPLTAAAQPQSTKIKKIIEVVKPTGLFNEQELLNAIKSTTHGLEGNNARKVIGRLGCMEKISPIPMWITEIKKQAAPDDDKDENYVPEEGSDLTEEEEPTDEDDESSDEDDESSEEDDDACKNDEHYFLFCGRITGNPFLKPKPGNPYRWESPPCEKCLKKIDDYQKNRGLF